LTNIITLVAACDVGTAERLKAFCDAIVYRCIEFVEIASEGSSVFNDFLCVHFGLGLCAREIGEFLAHAAAI
jgi:hypothetical protein